MPPATSSFAERVLDSATLADIEALRLLLEGQSVIDWHNLSLTCLLYTSDAADE